MKPVTPAIARGGVVNAASFTAQVSPGALASIFGSNFTGTGLDAIASLPLPSSLGGVSVLVNGVAAPVLYANSDQINFQIPWETKTGSATVAVSINGLASSQVNVTVQAAAPGLFVQGSHAVVQNSDFSLNSSSNPAKVGGTILAYLTGAGAVSQSARRWSGGGLQSSFRSDLDGDRHHWGTKPLSVVRRTCSRFRRPLAGEYRRPVRFDTAGNYPLTVTVDGQTSNSANRQRHPVESFAIVSRALARSVHTRVNVPPGSVTLKS